MVFTHPHEDHIGSGEAVLSQVTVDMVYMLDGYDEGIEGSLRQAVEQAGINVEAPKPEIRRSWESAVSSFWALSATVMMKTICPFVFVSITDRTVCFLQGTPEAGRNAR